MVQKGANSQGKDGNLRTTTGTHLFYIHVEISRLSNLCETREKQNEETKINIRNTVTVIIIEYLNCDCLTQTWKPKELN